MSFLSPWITKHSRNWWCPISNSSKYSIFLILWDNIYGYNDLVNFNIGPYLQSRSRVTSLRLLILFPTGVFLWQFATLVCVSFANLASWFIYIVFLPRWLNAEGHINILCVILLKDERFIFNVGHQLAPDITNSIKN